MSEPIEKIPQGVEKNPRVVYEERTPEGFELKIVQARYFPSPEEQAEVAIDFKGILHRGGCDDNKRLAEIFQERSKAWNAYWSCVGTTGTPDPELLAFSSSLYGTPRGKEKWPNRYCLDNCPQVPGFTVYLATSTNQDASGWLNERINPMNIRDWVVHDGRILSYRLGTAWAEKKGIPLVRTKIVPREMERVAHSTGLNERRLADKVQVTEIRLSRHGPNAWEAICKTFAEVDEQFRKWAKDVPDDGSHESVAVQVVYEDGDEILCGDSVYGPSYPDPDFTRGYREYREFNAGLAQNPWCGKEEYERFNTEGEVRTPGSTDTNLLYFRTYEVGGEPGPRKHADEDSRLESYPGRKIPAVRIELYRFGGEVPNGETRWGICSTFLEANECLRVWGLTAPRDGTSYDCGYRVIYADGERYSDIYGLVNSGVVTPSLDKHLRELSELRAGRAKNFDGGPEKYAEFLAEREKTKPGVREDNVNFLDHYWIGDPKPEGGGA